MKQPDPQPLPDSRLEQELSSLRGLPERDPQAARRGRERFLMEVRSLEVRRAADAGPWNRLKSTLVGKRGFAFSPLLAILLAVAILLAGAGTSVYAAQGSQPDQALYPIKLWSENARLQFAGDAQARIQLDQEFTDRRVSEIVAMNQAGKLARPEVSDRLQDLMDDAIQSASSLPGEGAKQALAALSANLARHQVQLEKLSQQANPRAAAEFARLVAMLEFKQKLAAQGARDPQALQKYLREMRAKNKKTGGNPEDLQTPGGANESTGPEKTAGPNTGANGKGGPEPEAQATRTPRANGQATPDNPGKGRGDK